MRKSLLTVESRSAVAGRAVTVYRLRGENGEQRALEVADTRRLFARSTLELRDAGDGSAPMIAGTALVYEQPADIGWFTEQLDRGALRKLLPSSPDVRGLFNHDPNIVLGRTAAGTLTLTDTPTGLDYLIGPLPDTQGARDATELVRTGHVTGSSFAFSVARDRWEDLEDGGLLRTILEIGDLYDVSPVTYPAYTQTSSGVRSLLDDVEDDGAMGQRASGTGDDESQLAGAALGSSEVDGHEAREAHKREQLVGAKRSRAMARRA